MTNLETLDTPRRYQSPPAWVAIARARVLEHARDDAEVALFLGQLGIEEAA